MLGTKHAEPALSAPRRDPRGKHRSTAPTGACRPTLTVSLVSLHGFPPSGSGRNLAANFSLVLLAAARAPPFSAAAPQQRDAGRGR